MDIENTEPEQIFTMSEAELIDLKTLVLAKIRELRKLRKDLEEKERSLYRKEMKLKNDEYQIELSAKDLEDKQNELEKIRAELLEAKTPEAKDKVRLAKIYAEIAGQNLNNTFENQEFIQGLSLILSDAKIIRLQRKKVEK